MLENKNIENILFLDIETVPLNPDYESLSEKSKLLWDKKAGFLKRNEESPGELYQRAGIYAEFGKIVCISAGFVTNRDGKKSFRVKSFYGDDEKALLTEFSQMLDKFCNRNGAELCAHNGKEFDFPYISRRMLINGMKLPDILNTAGKKPWEVSYLDTLELWKFGDYKSYTSLDLLTHIFDIPTPKDDIDGSMVADIYWKEKDIERIATYCEKDVLAIAQLFLRFRGEPLIPAENVEIIKD